MRARHVLPALALALATLPSPAAHAGPFAPGAAILSASEARLEQADDATTQVVLARGGGHAVFATRATNLFADDDPDPPGRLRLGGIFRRELAGGALELVAEGDQVDETTRELLLRGARAASVSDDGRWVAFATNQSLVPADANDNTDVYVRDMAVPRGAPGAFTLVSAKDGGDVPASYAPRPNPLPGRNPGSEVAPGSAISGNGRFVVFRTVELATDLPDRGAVDLAPDQLLVRDLRERRTTLVTRDRQTGDPVGGVQGPAVISADGTAIAWVGGSAPQQTRFLDGEQADPVAPFYLWRRIADGPGAPTRRITGIADPDDPGCPPGGFVTTDPTATGPCYGPLGDTEQGRSDITQRAPSLSADGFTVAFLAGAVLRPTAVNNPGLDLFVTSMAPGATRKASTVELTREGAPDDATQSLPLDAVALTADGSGAFVITGRYRFVLPALAPVGVLRTAGEGRDLYYVDLRRRTIERAVTGAGGEDPGADVQGVPSPSPDGRTVAFVSGASNLFFGDANQRADAFLAVRPDEQAAEPPPPDPGVLTPVITQEDEPAEPELGLTSSALRDGRLRIRVRAPAAGRLTVFARAGKPLRTVARGARSAKRAGRVEVTLRLTARERARLRRTRRLRATIRARFVPAAAGQRALTETDDATFALRAARKTKKKTTKKAAKRSATPRAEASR